MDLRERNRSGRYPLSGGAGREKPLKHGAYPQRRLQLLISCIKAIYSLVSCFVLWELHLINVWGRIFSWGRFWRMLTIHRFLVSVVSSLDPAPAFFLRLVLMPFCREHTGPKSAIVTTCMYWNKRFEFKTLSRNTHLWWSNGHDFRLSTDNAREIGVRLPVRELILRVHDPEEFSDRLIF
jgi:hypothetical protein